MRTILLGLIISLATTAQAQIPELGISKYFADTSTITFDDPQPGQYIIMYPKKFISDTTFKKKMVDDRFFDTLYTIIEALPGCTFEIGFHTDSEGSSTRNHNFTMRRSISFTAYLTRYCMIPRERIYYRGYGETELLYPCLPADSCTAEMRAKNQRMEFVICEIGDTLR